MMLRKAVSTPCVRSFSTSIRRRAKKDLNIAPKEYSCNIPPWKVEPPPTAKLITKELPAALIRPPCMPGQKPGERQTCVFGLDGVYCPPCKLRYKYPPFSENIDFMPSVPCWWKNPASCPADVSGDDDAKLASMTRRWECAYD